MFKLQSNYRALHMSTAKMNDDKRLVNSGGIIWRHIERISCWEPMKTKRTSRKRAKKAYQHYNIIRLQQE
jgi:hypothetical protein